METIKESFAKEFLSTIKQGVALVDFNTSWCAPCRAQDPIIKQLAIKFQNKAIVASLNIDKNRETALMLGIHSIPTLILFKNGEEIQRFIGLQPAETLSEAIAAALGTTTWNYSSNGTDVQEI